MKPQETAANIIANIGKVLIGKESAAELALVALGAEGHILLDDVPGVGKTMLAKALAISVGLDFRRIQCTPDLLPSDVTGLSVFNPQTAAFSFRPGPIIANIVLVDEINRATPRTQSSMLEAMEERQVTVDGETYFLQKPFIVVATENPVEFEGTFPLPEAQLDRFLLRLSLGYPRPEQEIKVLERLEDVHPIQSLKPVVDVAEIREFIQAKRKIFVEESLKTYIVELVNKTRSHPDLEFGASPRGAIALFNAARVLAAIRGRDFVLPEEIKYLAPYILAHRVVVSAQAAIKGLNGTSIVQEILQEVEAPTEVALHA
ncbi:MAG TPA: MoxR family ATPase [Bacillota bacterium]|nr:MoxR family ATPase [Bacillota bacterium]